MESIQERHQRELFRLLHETAQNAGVVVIEDRINRRGGICRLDEKVMVIYDVHAPARERNRLILGGLKLVDLEHVYVPPKVRELLTERQDSQSGILDQEAGSQQLLESREQGHGTQYLEQKPQDSPD